MKMSLCMPNEWGSNIIKGNGKGDGKCVRTILTADIILWQQDLSY